MLHDIYLHRISAFDDDDDENLPPDVLHSCDQICCTYLSVHKVPFVTSQGTTFLKGAFKGNILLENIGDRDFFIISDFEIVKVHLFNTLKGF